MNIDITKKDRQQLGATKWRNAHGIGTLNYPPRFGKTFCAIEFIINPHITISEDNFVIILVPSEIIAKVWEGNLKSYCKNVSKVEIVTANYLVMNPDVTKVCTLLIVDELQKYLTIERKAMLDGTRIKSRFRLGLTGTYPKGINWIEELYPIVDLITEEEAVNNKWVAPYIEYNILLELPNADKVRYEKFSKPISETLQLFKPLLGLLVRENNRRLFDGEFALINACHSGFETISLYGHKKYITYDQLCNAIATMLGWHVDLDITIPKNLELHNLWSPIAIHNRAKTFIDYVRKRNEILIDNNVKLQTIVEIITNNKVPTIIFNESTVFANKIADYLNASFDDYRVACYHSRIDSSTMIDPTTGDYFKFQTGDRKGQPKILGKESIKKIVIEGFKNGYYNALSTARSMDEGLDVPTIEQVICTGGTTNPLTYQQRTARGKTVDFFNPNKIAKIYNLVFDDFTDSNNNLMRSRDKSKLILRQQETASTVKWVTSLEEINLLTHE